MPVSYRSPLPSPLLPDTKVQFIFANCLRVQAEAGTLISFLGLFPLLCPTFLNLSVLGALDS